MVPVALKYMIDIVIPTLLENLDETKDLYIRHGSLVAVGFVVRGLADVGSVKDLLGKNTTMHVGARHSRKPLGRSYGFKSS